MTVPSLGTTTAARRPAQLWPLYAAGFVTAFGAHAVAANLAGYGHGRHVSLVELGGQLAVYDGAEVVLKPVFGALSDRVGAKVVLVGGLVGFAAASALFVVVGEPGLLGVARLAQGSAAAAFSPVAGALVAAQAGQHRAAAPSAGTAAPRASAIWPAPSGAACLWPLAATACCSSC